MPTQYLTPAALSYFSQFILALLIAGFFVALLATSRVRRPAHLILLTGFFACIAVLILLFTLDASFSPTDRLYRSTTSASTPRRGASRWRWHRKETGCG